jgi:hypothetical protein
MKANIRSSMLDFIATAHAITGNFGYTGESASKIKYYVNLIV